MVLCRVKIGLCMEGQWVMAHRRLRVNVEPRCRATVRANAVRLLRRTGGYIARLL
jgi:hypothetical protein